ncbi:DUF3823 domain-containing protein [Mucilaginibacter sp. RS28]|uniref:DUF3823 domain-containing protein n=1 Tax=Mucilaginibacter straminoryzae TaxID=2932774 RepID=A0A9X2B7R8_9SPHI|nr:DUF3823 domain-containing protein [Mucilaginibacter straminoryzae]MCJ8208636.1 DUF3823 domain-containing protein [Mucilaginibacter straminoryzae]
MKKLFYLLIFTTVIAASSCKKDNYKAPGSTLKGRLVYKGDPIGVEYNQVPFELYQSGFGKVGPIGASFDQDGNYSALLFDGNYRFTIPAGQGPFMWKERATGGRDTIAITVNGDQTMNIEVTPYYMIRSPQMAASGGKVNATFNIEKVVTDANAKGIERVNLYINKTQFVSGADNIASAEMAGSSITSMNNLSMSVTIPTISPTQNYVFARIGIKIAGVEDMIFSPVQKIQF